MLGHDIILSTIVFPNQSMLLFHNNCGGHLISLPNVNVMRIEGYVVYLRTFLIVLVAIKRASIQH